MIFRLFKYYNASLRRKPLFVSMMTGFTLSATADLIGNFILVIKFYYTFNIQHSKCSSDRSITTGRELVGWVSMPF